MQGVNLWEAGIVVRESDAQTFSINLAKIQRKKNNNFFICLKDLFHPAGLKRSAKCIYFVGFGLFYPPDFYYRVNGWISLVPGEYENYRASWYFPRLYVSFFGIDLFSNTKLERGLSNFQLQHRALLCQVYSILRTD